MNHRFRNRDALALSLIGWCLGAVLHHGFGVFL
jgi:hypothetical protein